MTTPKNLDNFSSNFWANTNFNLGQKKSGEQEFSGSQYGPQEYQLVGTTAPYLSHEEHVAANPLQIPVIPVLPAAHLLSGAPAGSTFKPFISLVENINSIRAQTEPPFHAMLSPTPTPLHGRLPEYPQNPLAISTPQYKVPPEAPKPAKPLEDEILLLHDFVKQLPTDSPSPFNEEIFVDTALTYKSERTLRTFHFREADVNGTITRYTESGFVPGSPKKYRAHSIVSANHKMEVEGGGRVIEGFCTVWTRKFPEGWDGLCFNAHGEVEVEEALKAQGTKRKRAEEEDTPENEIIWQYSAYVTVMKEIGQTIISCLVPKRVIQIDEVSYDLEPAWEDVVEALKTRVHVDETEMHWPQCRRFSDENRSQPAFNEGTKGDKILHTETGPPDNVEERLLRTLSRDSNQGHIPKLQHELNQPISRPVPQNHNSDLNLSTESRSQTTSTQRAPVNRNFNLNPLPPVNQSTTNKDLLIKRPQWDGPVKIQMRQDQPINSMSCLDMPVNQELIDRVISYDRRKTEPVYQQHEQDKMTAQPPMRLWDRTVQDQTHKNMVRQAAAEQQQQQQQHQHATHPEQIVESMQTNGRHSTDHGVEFPGAYPQYHSISQPGHQQPLQERLEALPAQNVRHDANKMVAENLMKNDVPDSPAHLPNAKRPMLAKNQPSPKKQKSLAGNSPAKIITSAPDATLDGKIKRKRGRPRKNPVVDETGSGR